MLDRYLAALALTSLLLGAAPAAGHHRHHGKARSQAAVPAVAGLEVYSRRALRRARIILQLKLMELHQQQLERVRAAVERAIGASPTPFP
jgi:hypothetical protein